MASLVAGAWCTPRELLALDGTASSHANDGRFHFGAVYFRGQNNPPREDWERDHRAA